MPGQAQQPHAGNPQGIPPELANLPPQVKQQVMNMHAQGLPAEQIAQYLQQQVQNNAQPGQMGPMPKTPGAPPPGMPPGGPTLQ